MPRKGHDSGPHDYKSLETKISRTPAFQTGVFHSGLGPVLLLWVLEDLDMTHARADACVCYILSLAVSTNWWSAVRVSS